MGLQWPRLSKKLRSGVLTRMVELRDLPALSLSASMVGFAAMDVEWRLLAIGAREVLMRSLLWPSDRSAGARRGGTMSEQTVSNVIHSLGAMGAVAEDFPPSQLARLFELIGSIDPFSTHGLSNVIYGLAKMRITWQQLPSRTVSNLERNLLSSSFQSSQQALSNVLWGLGQMEVAWTSPEREAEAAKIALEVKGKLYELLSQQAVSMADQGLSNSLLGLAKVPCYFN